MNAVHLFMCLGGFFTIAACFENVVPRASITYTLSASLNKSMDWDVCCSSSVYPPDAYCKTFLSEDGTTDTQNRSPTNVTDNISDDYNPHWPEVYTVSRNIGPDSKAMVIFEVWDADAVDSDDPIGSCYIPLSNMFSDPGESGTGVLRLPLESPYGYPDNFLLIENRQVNWGSTN